MTSDLELREVQLLQLPVRLWARAKQQSDELQREFALIAMSAGTGHNPDHQDVPARLTALVAELDASFGSAGAPQEELLFQAAAEGRLVVDLVYTLPVAAAAASRHLGAMLDEADAYCARGEHLLTLAAEPEVVRFRQWFLAQVVGQLEGGDPVAWPDWSA